MAAGKGSGHQTFASTCRNRPMPHRLSTKGMMQLGVALLGNHLIRAIAWKKDLNNYDKNDDDPADFFNGPSSITNGPLITRGPFCSSEPFIHSVRTSFPRRRIVLIHSRT
jgi:hypothetical protein